MNMRSILLGGVALFALGSVASAADLGVVKAPPYAGIAGFNWSGIYFGGEAGYGFSSKELDVNGFNTTSALGFTNPGSIGTNASGGFGGLTAAFRYQGGGSPWVFGVKAAADLTGINSNSNPDLGTSIASLIATGATAPVTSVSIPWDGRVGGEIGYAVMPTLLLFVDGGVAFGEIKTNTTATCLSGACTTSLGTMVLQDNTSNTHTGWWAGLGAKYAVLPNLIIGAEWFYTDLGTRGVTLQGQGFTGAATTFNVNDRAAYNKIMATIEVKFP